MPGTILVAEDHDVTRQGLCEVLEGRLDVRVTGATGDGLEVLPLVDAHEPDLLLLDLALPGLNGLDILHRLNRQESPVRVIVLSMRSERAYVAEAMNAGAHGYVLKGEPVSEIIRAVKTAMQGGRYVSDEVADAVGSDEGERKDHLEFTDREQEVLQLTAEGMGVKEIAERLSIDEEKVRSHRDSLEARLGVRNAMELMAYALRHNPVPRGRRPAGL